MPISLVRLSDLPELVKIREAGLKTFTTEGGISARTQRTYVHSECPYIKVDVHFTALNGDSSDVNGDPDDLIESISHPYLAWSVMD